MDNTQNQFVVTIDSNQLNMAVNKCKAVYYDLIKLFRNYIHGDKLTGYYKKTYYFKILDNDTKNGIQVCVCPKTRNLDIYIIKNNKKNINNINAKNMISDADDIFNYFVKNVHYDYMMMEHLKNVYDNLCNKNYSNFKVSLKTNIINVVETNSQNGYYIYFNNHSFANIGIIKNGEYFDVNSIEVLSMDELDNTLLHMINSKKHTLSYYNIIDTRYLDCDMSEYVNCNDQSFDTNSQCDEYDPV
jgi:hypothetical protein